MNRKERRVAARENVTVVAEKHIKVMLKSTCVSCNKEYEREKEMAESLAIAASKNNATRIGVCDACQDNGIDEGKAIIAYLKQHKNEGWDSAIVALGNID